ncbi:MAG: Holliday junction resolvase RuvX [Alphaproteobacteria bacterium]|nr:Holliday junction resolvase RuvX [Alphaproteobacteria bacterium]
MAIRNPSQLKALLKPGQRLLGLDFGDRRIGLALSDPSLTIASALSTIERQSMVKDVAALIRSLRDNEAGGMIVGLPLQMDGTEGERAEITRKFTTSLLQRVDIEIAFWDERLSSAAVERMLIAEADMSRKRRQEVIDKTSAAYILQGALDAMAYRANAPL